MFLYVLCGSAVERRKRNLLNFFIVSFLLLLHITPPSASYSSSHCSSFYLILHSCNLLFLIQMFVLFLHSVISPRYSYSYFFLLPHHHLRSFTSTHLPYYWVLSLIYLIISPYFYLFASHNLTSLSRNLILSSPPCDPSFIVTFLIFFHTFLLLLRPPFHCSPTFFDVSFLQLHLF
jgi:hypothetical protein